MTLTCTAQWRRLTRLGMLSRAVLHPSRLAAQQQRRQQQPGTCSATVATSPTLVAVFNCSLSSVRLHEGMEGVIGKLKGTPATISPEATALGIWGQHVLLTLVQRLAPICSAVLLEGPFMQPWAQPS